MGTTGVGKSKLAVDLALTLGGEIVNADSMQIYKGNSEGVMTARPSAADEKKCPHHVYNCVDAFDSEIAETFNVNRYLDLALPAIAQIQERGRIPIVCGGTNYYIESLLFKKLQNPGLSLEIDCELLRKTLSDLTETCKEDESMVKLLKTLEICVPADTK